MYGEYAKHEASLASCGPWLVVSELGGLRV